MVEYSQLGEDGQETADNHAEDYVSNTYNQDNYQKWADRAGDAAENDAAARALANQLGLDMDDLSQFNEKQTSNLETAIERNKYQKGLQRFGGDNPEEQWRNAWLSGLR